MTQTNEEDYDDQELVTICRDNKGHISCFFEICSVLSLINNWLKRPILPSLRPILPLLRALIRLFEDGGQARGRKRRIIRRG